MGKTVSFSKVDSLYILGKVYFSLSFYFELSHFSKFILCMLRISLHLARLYNIQEAASVLWLF